MVRFYPGPRVRGVKSTSQKDDARRIRSSIELHSSDAEREISVILPFPVTTRAERVARMHHERSLVHRSTSARYTLNEHTSYGDR